MQPRRKFGLCFLAATFVVAVISISVNAQRQNQPSTSPRSPQREQGPRHEYLGLGSCARCHDQPLDRPSRDRRDFCFLNEFLFFERRDGQDESTQFSRKDKHLLAYKLLSGPIGRAMAERLQPFGYAFEQQGESWQWHDKRCLSCHANWQWKDGQTEPPPFYQDGVSCEACHGPSSDWERVHDRIDWRTKPVAEKEALGFVDVRNPIKRARQCFSCHIGNPQQGKVVTHEMYAAGHPPLPGVELETFAAEMPPHWRYLREKTDFVHRTEFISGTCQGFEDHALTDLPRTKAVVIGGVMALRESLNLFAGQAADAQSEWPELAVFDCQACHHELQSPGWRLERGYRNHVPGRPTLPAWPQTLVAVGIRHLAEDDEAEFRRLNAQFESRLARLRSALDTKPYGNSAEIDAVVNGDDGLIAWLDGIADELLKHRFDASDAQRALATLQQLSQSELRDFHSARQIAWAVKVIQTELNIEYPVYQPRDQIPQNDLSAQTRRDTQDIAIYRRWLANVLQSARQQVDDGVSVHRMNERLFLKLPAGQENSIGESLPQSLDVISDYDAEWFRRAMRETFNE